jgi:hypothetical protein
VRRRRPDGTGGAADIDAAHIGGDPTAWLRDLAEKGRYQQDVFA